MNGAAASWRSFRFATPLSLGREPQRHRVGRAITPACSTPSGRPSCGAAASPAPSNSLGFAARSPASLLGTTRTSRPTRAAVRGSARSRDHRVDRPAVWSTSRSPAPIHRSPIARATEVGTRHRSSTEGAMKQTIKTAPPYSIVLVMDRTVGEVPEALGSELTAATPTCVAVGTFSASDGLTQITFGYLSPNHTVLAEAFDGMLETPANRISVCTALDDILLR